MFRLKVPVAAIVYVWRVQEKDCAISLMHTQVWGMQPGEGVCKHMRTNMHFLTPHTYSEAYLKPVLQLIL